MNHPRPHAKVEIYQCQNELCISKSDRWIIQINPDGSIPERDKGPKEFDASDKAMDYGRSVVEQTKREMGER
jgi:hypothetical protein